MSLWPLYNCAKPLQNVSRVKLEDKTKKNQHTYIGVAFERDAQVEKKRFMWKAQVKRNILESKAQGNRDTKASSTCLVLATKSKPKPKSREKVCKQKKSQRKKEERTGRKPKNEDLSIRLQSGSLSLQSGLSKEDCMS